jgi:tetratricopeptide (TPR) repeat protein
MKRALLVAIACGAWGGCGATGAALAAAANPSSSASPASPVADPAAELRGHATYWLERFGPLEIAPAWRNHLEAVFARVAAAHGGRSLAPPARLVLVEGARDPLAIALRDGSVVLDRAMLLAIYSSLDRAPTASGDDVLALVLGHELAHLTADDLWASASFEPPPDAEERGRYERRADAQGLLTALMAGFDPARALRGGGHQLLARLAPGSADAQAVATGRLGRLETELLRLAERSDELRLGLRLAELGRHQDALLLLERFRELFPAREVLNNIGATHLAIAFEALASCDGRTVDQSYLPILFDSATLDERVRLRGSEGADCVERRAVAGPLQAAVDALAEAVDRDPRYLPALLNLGAALLLSNRTPAALARSHEARDLVPGNAGATALWALAFHRFGKESGLPGASDQALRELERFAESPVALFNRASILAELGRTTSAREVFAQYLARDPWGPMAGVAREWLGTTTPTRPTSGSSGAAPRSQRPAPPTGSSALPAPPIPLDRLPTPLPEELETRPLVIGTARATVVRGPGWVALALDGVVELVEQEGSGLLARDLAARWGPPRLVVPTAFGERWAFPGLAADVRDGAVVALVHNREGPRR